MIIMIKLSNRPSKNVFATCSFSRERAVLLFNTLSCRFQTCLLSQILSFSCSLSFSQLLEVTVRWHTYVGGGRRHGGRFPCAMMMCVLPTPVPLRLPLTSPFSPWFSSSSLRQNQYLYFIFTMAMVHAGLPLSHKYCTSSNKE